MSNRQTSAYRPLLFFGITLISIFLTEFLIMLVLSDHASLKTQLVDPLLLALLIAPELYVFLYRPLEKNLKRSLEAEEHLSQLNRVLEQKVLEPTEELNNVNRLLRTEYTEALKLSEEKWRNVIESLGVGVAVIGPDMRIISANGQMRKWHPKLDISPNPLCYQVFVSDDANQVCEGCLVQASFREEKTTYGIVEREIDGRLRSHKIIVSPLFDKNGRLIAVTQVVEDVTDQKKYREELKQAIRDKTSELIQAESRYQSLVQNSSDGIFVFDPFSLEIQEANKQFLTLLGYSENEILKATLPNFVSADEEDIKRNVDLMLQHGQTVNIIRLYKAKNGNLIDVEVSASVIQCGKSKVCLANVRDIRERKRAEEELSRGVKQLEKTLYAGVNALVQLAEKRDPYTAGHQKRVSRLAGLIAKEMGLEEAQIECVRLAGALHDIGKIDIPIDILNKPGSLKEMEMSIIKTHCLVSYEVLEQIPFNGNVAEIVLQHHERLDGSGYPKGLKQDDILIEAKILSVADVLEAMSSHRPYRPSKGLESALQHILDNKGILYDAHVVEAVLRIYNGKDGLLQKMLEEVA